MDPLADLRAPTDSLTASEAGVLEIDGCSARDLVAEFGSPLYVVSERTLRLNYRRIRDALQAAWPQPSRVLYAIKANNNLAIRAILNDEGAGGDCFGIGELTATFAGGADPDSIVMNGSSKSDAELRGALERGVRINMDAEDEPERIARIAAELGTPARVNVRLKVAPQRLNEFTSDYDGGATPIVEQVLGGNWGLSLDTVARLIPSILASSWLRLEGYHVHIGRTSQEPAFYGAWAGGIAGAVAELRDRTGFVPTLLDVGGGYPRERDVESRSLARNPHPVQAYVGAITGGLLEGLTAAGIPIPELWVEPGRSIVGSAVTLLGSVGAVKRDDDRTWVHSDLSLNNLLRVDIAQYAYHVLAADRLFDAAEETADLVGPLCTGGPLASARRLPRLRRGDLVAVLDAGMYAETMSAQMNGVPRPATVLVNAGVAEVVKVRETVDDVFRMHRIPDRLRPTPPQRLVVSGASC